jgi:hypothetical protein
MKTEKVVKLLDQPEVKVARLKLETLEDELQELVLKVHPSIGDKEELQRDARNLLDRKPIDSETRSSIIRKIATLEEAIGIQKSRLEAAKAAAAKKMIKNLEPEHRRLLEALIKAAKDFADALAAHDDFVEQLWTTGGLYQRLPACWNLKWKILLSAPPGKGGKWDIFIESLKGSLHDLR